MLFGIMYSVARDSGEEVAEKGADGAVNIKTTSPSAKEIIIQSMKDERARVRMVFVQLV